MIPTQNELGNNEIAHSPTRVLVRAFGGEPVIMEAVSVAPGVVTVRRPGSEGTTVQLSYESVYEYEVPQYRKLVKAFTSGDGKALDRLWRTTPTLG